MESRQGALSGNGEYLLSGSSHDQAESLRRVRRRLDGEGQKTEAESLPDQDVGARVIAITSGKGGVGKTNLVANLAYALSKMGSRVVILDADLSLANVDVLLGLTPRYNIEHLLKGGTMEEITVVGPGGIRILPASSGAQELSELTEEQRINLLTEMGKLESATDFLLVDTAAGISSNVMYFNSAAQEILVVVSPEPTSIVDAYALMKVLFQKYSEKYFKLVVNFARDEEEALEVFRKLSMAADRFLNISIDYWGYISTDENFSRAVRRQKILTEAYPDSRASRCFFDLAKKINSAKNLRRPKGGVQFFLRSMISENKAEE